MVFTSVACMSCAVFLAFPAKKRLCICSKGWIPPENTDPALADAAQPGGNQPSAPAQMLALGLALQQLRRMGLSRPTQCPVCPVGIGMPIGGANRFQFFPAELPVFPSLTTLLLSYWLRCVQEPALRQMNSTF